MKKRVMLIILGVLVGGLLLFLTLEGSKKLHGINYILLDVDSNVFLCYYEGDKDGGQCVTRKGSINEVFWNDQFIIAYADGGGKKEKIYYIIEQLETDTFIDVGDGKKIPLNTQYGEPWITEEYEFYNDFNKRLQDLSLDTTKMHRYAWKYWVGIY